MSFDSELSRLAKLPTKDLLEFFFNPGEWAQETFEAARYELEARGATPNNANPEKRDLKMRGNSFAENDAFLNEIADAKRQSDIEFEQAKREHQREFDLRFSDDLLLKERLSQFAKQNELDTALVAAWEELKHYSTIAKHENCEPQNELEINQVETTRKGREETVSFFKGSQKFAISLREWDGIESDTYAEFSFFEDGTEVFAISCSVDFVEFGRHYSCNSICAFRKRGNWAKVLLYIYNHTRINEINLFSDFNNSRANESKMRFEE